jgi:hypothetical protein
VERLAVGPRPGRRLRQRASAARPRLDRGLEKLDGFLQSRGYADADIDAIFDGNGLFTENLLK